MTATTQLARRMVPRPKTFNVKQPPTQVVPNNSGGPAHVIDVWSRLNRFLILGIEGGTYYVTEDAHIADNVTVVNEALQTNFKRAIDMAVEISTSGRAPKNDYAIYVLARGAAWTLPPARNYALNKLNEVCRTGTHLFQFVSMVDKLRGWGPSLRRAVANWYLSKTPDQVAFQTLKYRNREGWTHRDLLRKTHPQTNIGMMNNVFQFITTGELDWNRIPVIPPILEAYVQAQVCEPEGIANLVREANLQREMIPTQHLTNPIVAEALAEKMPYTALLRNLGNLSSYGVLRAEHVARLTDEAYIKRSRVHPISILIANRTYAQGGGYRSSKTWPVLPEAVTALDTAFSLAFQNVNPTGKRFLIGVDVSGSMGASVNNTNLTSSEAAAALALQWARTEPWVQVFGFDTNLIPLDITHRSTLNDAIKAVKPWNYGGTDCAKLIQFALDNRIDTDVFVIITDNETNAGRRNPAQVLREYRQAMNNPDAALVVLATAATRFSIADPNDPRMLDIAGFDSAVPAIINEFVSGNI